MKISFTSFDSTRGLGKPRDQSGSRRQKIICFEITWASAVEDLENFAMFFVQSALYFSSVIVNRNLANGSFKKWKWFPED